MNGICDFCKNKSIGCSKFCSDYKDSYERCIIYAKFVSEMKRKEQEIRKRMRVISDESK